MIPLAVSRNQLLEQGVREGEGAGLVPGLVLEGEHAEDLARIAEAWPRLPGSPIQIDGIEGSLESLTGSIMVLLSANDPSRLSIFGFPLCLGVF